MTTPEFVHLHTHTEYSFLDGAIKIKDLVKKASEFKMNALAITDHGGMFGAIEFYEACKDAKIKPIIGFEAYIAPHSRLDKSSGGKDERSNHHLVLLAYNNVGYHNLMKLSSIGYLEGFYYKPRIDTEVLRQHSEGIIGTTACIGGAVPSALLHGDRAKAKAIAEEYLSIFGEENFYFELQNHGIADELKVLDPMIDLGNELGVPFIAANDAHYLNQKDALSHEVLLCIQTQTTMADPNRYRFTTDQVYFKSQAEMAKLFATIPSALQNTVVIANRCEVSVKSEKKMLPIPEVPSEYTDVNDYLTKLATAGLHKKYPEITPELTERLEFELKIICSMDFAGYFLIVREFVTAAKNMGIMVGCRGSAAGSLVAYTTEITDVDPIKFDLLFERFLNPERVSMPDADIDFADNDRYKVIDYVVAKYGRESVCQIINFGRMKAKMVVKDVARAMGIAISESSKLANMITEKTLDESIKANGELGKIIQNNPQFQELFTHAKVLEGLARQAGMHAGGVIIAPEPVVNWAPLFKQPNIDTIMTQFDMNYVEKAGLIKMDFLGLRTLTVLQETLTLIKRYHNITLDLWHLPENDPVTYALFGRGDTTGVFQFESQGMQDYLRKLKPTCIEDIIAMTALYRPGPMANIDTFIHRKHGKEKVEYQHPILKSILDVTYGVIVYQEQVMRIAQVMGGFTLGQADTLRKAMGKKQIETMDKMCKLFVEGAAAKNINKKTAEDVYQYMAKFAEYGFNKAHATVYGHVSYQAAYLKAHYGLEYMTANLTSWLGDQEQFLVIRNEAERVGIGVLPPDVNASEMNCSVESNKIRMGLSAIKNVGKAGEAILTALQTKGKFASLFDLCRTVDVRQVNKKSLESLVCAGALDSLPGTRAQLFASIDKALEYGVGFQKDRASGQTNIFDDLFAAKSSAASDATAPEPELVAVAPWPYTELLAKEKEILNFYVSGHPLDHFQDEIRGFSSTNFKPESLRRLKDGESITVGGLVTSIKTHLQRNGQQMAFAKMEDFDGEIELLVFGETFAKFGHLLGLDSMILAHGNVSIKEGESTVKIRVDNVIALSDAREKLARCVHVKLKTPGLDKEFLAEIRQSLVEHTGNCSLVIHLITAESNEYRIRAKNIRINPSTEVIKQLRTKLGKEYVWISKSAA